MNFRSSLRKLLIGSALALSSAGLPNAANATVVPFQWLTPPSASVVHLFLPSLPNATTTVVNGFAFVLAPGTWWCSANVSFTGTGLTVAQAAIQASTNAPTALPAATVESLAGQATATSTAGLSVNLAPYIITVPIGAATHWSYSAPTYTFTNNAYTASTNSWSTPTAPSTPGWAYYLTHTATGTSPIANDSLTCVKVS